MAGVWIGGLLLAWIPVCEHGRRARDPPASLADGDVQRLLFDEGRPGGRDPWPRAQPGGRQWGRQLRARAGVDRLWVHRPHGVGARSAKREAVARRRRLAQSRGSAPIAPQDAEAEIRLLFVVRRLDGIEARRADGSGPPGRRLY